MSTIIQCPNCATRYRLKFMIEDGQQVRCPSCKTVWRFQSEAEDGQVAFDDPESQAGSPAAVSEAYAAALAQATASAFAGAPKLEEAGGQEEAFSKTDYNGDEAPAPSYEALRAGEAETYQPDEGSAAAEAAETEDAKRLWAASVAENVGDRFEGSPVDYIRGSALAPFPLAADENADQDADATNNWAAELAGAINRAGFEPSAQSLMAESDEAQRQQSGSAFNNDDDANRDVSSFEQDPQEDENQRIAAERLSAFWRGERAVTSYEADEFKGFAGGMPMRQPRAEEASSRGGLALAAAWGSYLAVAGGVMASVVLFPEHVVEAMPGAAAYYEQVGVTVGRDPLGFENVTYEWLKRDEKSVLEVRGDVVNLTNAALNVPLLHITVRDDQSAEIAKTVAIIVKEPLQSATKTAFTLEFISPPKSISGIELRFGS
ncbi:MAG: hypothetical protein H7X92_05595 [Chitinophagales bacterium]|nr:hypothetical protein [Hyphomicrobiales bacterium]